MHSYIVCTFFRNYVCMYILYVDTFIHLCMHTYIHKYIHTYIHTYFFNNSVSPPLVVDLGRGLCRAGIVGSSERNGQCGERFGMRALENIHSAKRRAVHSPESGQGWVDRKARLYSSMQYIIHPFIHNK